MLRFFIVIFNLIIYVKTSHTANEDFYKQALETIGHHLSVRLNPMQGKISVFPDSYLNNTVNLYIACKDNIRNIDTKNNDTKSDPVFKFLDICLNLPYGTNVTIKNNGTTLSIDENHDIYVNNRKIQADINNQDTLNNAINKNRWIFIQLLLRKIAVCAEGYLLKSPKTYDIAKEYASNQKMPSEFRKKLLLPFIESNDLDLINWALIQPMSKTTKETYLQKLVTKYLSQDDSLAAEVLILTHLDPYTEAFQKNAHSLYVFYRKKNQDQHAEYVLTEIFPWDSPIRHNLIKDLLLTQLAKNDLSSTEIILNKFSKRGSESHNQLTTLLCVHLAEQNKFDEARDIATYNMNIKSIDYLTLDRSILKEQVKYLKSKHSQLRQ
jgi:hypothetical protein